MEVSTLSLNDFFHKLIFIGCSSDAISVTNVTRIHILVLSVIIQAKKNVIVKISYYWALTNKPIRRIFTMTFPISFSFTIEAEA
ncbi:hypothetical protein IGI67_002256 [Enterococcus sp. AZ196]